MVAVATSSPRTSQLATRRPRLSLLLQRPDLGLHRSRYVLARLLLVALAFTSINGALAALTGRGITADYWYLYLSPVLVAALSFGLRGGLLAAAVAVVALVTLDTRVAAFMAAEQARLAALVTALSAPTDMAAPSPSAAAVTAEMADALSRQLQIMGTQSVHMLGAIVMLCLSGGIVGWQVDQGRHRDRALLALAHQDGPTETLTAWLWMELLEDEVRRSARYGRQFVLLLLDVDSLRKVNAELGRTAGDAALRYLADVMRAHVRSVDRVGRLGGDEFGVLLPETDMAAGAMVAERVLRALETQPMALDHGRSLDLGLSIGLAVYPGDGADHTELLGAAERALAQAKARGGRCWHAPPEEGEESGQETPAVPAELTGPRIILPQRPPRVRRRRIEFSQLHW